MKNLNAKTNNTNTQTNNTIEEAKWYHLNLELLHVAFVWQEGEHGLIIKDEGGNTLHALTGEGGLEAIIKKLNCLKGTIAKALGVAIGIIDAIVQKIKSMFAKKA